MVHPRFAAARLFDFVTPGPPRPLRSGNRRILGFPEHRVESTKRNWALKRFDLCLSENENLRFYNLRFCLSENGNQPGRKRIEWVFSQADFFAHTNCDRTDLAGGDEFLASPISYADVTPREYGGLGICLSENAKGTGDAGDSGNFAWRKAVTRSAETGDVFYQADSYRLTQADDEAALAMEVRTRVIVVQGFKE